MTRRRYVPVGCRIKFGGRRVMDSSWTNGPVNIDFSALTGRDHSPRLSLIHIDYHGGKNGASLQKTCTRDNQPSLGGPSRVASR